MSFDPYNRPLKIQKYIETRNPKVGIYFEVWRFIPSHYFPFLGTWDVTPKLPSWLGTLQAFALLLNPNVVTLILGSRPRQGDARLQANREAWESPHMLSGVQGVWGNEPSHSQVNSHFESWSPQIDSQILRAQLQGSKPISWRSYLYHWKDIET
jgi:hypothetical protein